MNLYKNGALIEATIGFSWIFTEIGQEMGVSKNRGKTHKMDGL